MDTNDEPDEKSHVIEDEQVIEDFYNSLPNPNGKTGNSTQKKTQDVDFNKIASQINSSGKSKWKNSTKPKTSQNKPKHIRFSSSEDELNENAQCDQENEKQKKIQPEKIIPPKVSQPMQKNISAQKECALESISKKNLIETFTLNEEKKVNNKKNSKPLPTIDYTKFEDIYGAPRINDKIAFQILEISSHFTPEVSEYKIGNVVEFDSKSNEVTLKLDSEYNSVLKKPSKFSVVFEDTEDEHNSIYPEEKLENDKEDELIQLDWRNLMNVKLIPEGVNLNPKQANTKTSNQKPEPQSSKSNTEPQDLNKIASNINNQGKKKFKNCNKSTSKKDEPTHVRFSSNDNSSSTSSDDEIKKVIEEKKQKKSIEKVVTNDKEKSKIGEMEKTKTLASAHKTEDMTISKSNVDTNNFVIQIGNVFELNSQSGEVNIKFNSNSGINFKLNQNQTDKNEEEIKEKKKENKRKTNEDDWEISMNIKLIPNEINLNINSKKTDVSAEKVLSQTNLGSEKKSHKKKREISESENEEYETLVKKATDLIQKSQNQPNTSFKKSEQNISHKKTGKTNSDSRKKNEPNPKHVRFSSSLSDSSSSSSSSSDSEQVKSTKFAEKPKESPQNNNKQLQQSPQNIQQQPKLMTKYYEPSKEEQVNAVSYNRSFLIQNTKDIQTFKKVFNQTKLNAPKPEEFLPKENVHEQNLEIDESKNKETQLQRSSNPDFSKFELLNDVPRINDKIAFQILEISSNLSPEVSEYKLATVLGFDKALNEIFLKLDTEYNSILDNSGKFSVVLEETDNEATSQAIKNESFEMKEDSFNELGENVFKFDLRKLMNIRLIPRLVSESN